MGGYGNIAAITWAFRAVCARHPSRSEDEVELLSYTGKLRPALCRHGFHVDRIALMPRHASAGKRHGRWLRPFAEAC